MSEEGSLPEQAGAPSSVPTRRQAATAIAFALGRSALTAGLVVVAYALVPIGRFELGPFVFFLIATAGFAVLVVVQIMAIRRSTRPTLRAVEALSAIIPLSFLVFAMLYLIVSESIPGAFTEALGKVDAVYLSVSVLSTVGFGDVTAVAPLARIVVTLQMLIDLVLTVIVAQAITGAIAKSRESH